MNAFDTLAAAGMAQAAGILGEPITVAGQTYPAVVDSFRMSREMRDAGFRVDYELVAVIARADMPTPPADGALGQYQGRTVRIVANGVSSDTISHTLKFGYAS